jgi:hypothetical protein
VPPGPCRVPCTTLLPAGADLEELLPRAEASAPFAWTLLCPAYGSCAPVPNKLAANAAQRTSVLGVGSRDDQGCERGALLCVFLEYSGKGQQALRSFPAHPSQPCLCQTVLGCGPHILILSLEQFLSCSQHQRQPQAGVSRDKSRAQSALSAGLTNER